MKRILLLPLTALCLSGCLVSNDDQEKEALSIFMDPGTLPVQWEKVSDTPPTFKPKGMEDPDATSAMDGEWVIGKSGTHYFLPFYGVRGAGYSDVLAALPEAPAAGAAEGLGLETNDPGLLGKANPGKLLPFGKDGE